MTKILSLCLLFALHVHAAVGVRLILGLGDRATVRWDESVTMDRGRVLSIEGWRFDGEDAVTGTSWKVSTHPIRLFGAGKKGAPPAVANGETATITYRAWDASTGTAGTLAAAAAAPGRPGPRRRDRTGCRGKGRR